MTDHARARLVVQTAQGQREFDQDRVVVGREQTCDVVVADPRASRHHLTFERQGDAWYAVDSSSGGTSSPGSGSGGVPLHPGATVLALGDPQGETVHAWQTVPVVRHRSRPPRRRTSAGPAAGRRRPAAVPPAHRDRSPPPPYVPTPPPRAATRRSSPSRSCRRASSPTARRCCRPHAVAGPLGDDRARPVQRHRARRPARLAVPRPPRPRPAGGRPRPRQLQRRLRQRPAGSSARRALEPGYEVIVGNQTFRWDGAQLLSSATQHEFTLYADGLSRRRRRRQAAAGERLVHARPVVADRGDRPVGRRQVDAARAR